MSKKYVNNRGTTVYEKPYSQYTSKERHDILYYYIRHGRALARENFEVSQAVMSGLITSENTMEKLNER